MTISFAAMLLTVGCSSAPDVQTAVLHCRATEGGECCSFYSFTAGAMTTPPADFEQVDILYYFDNDDCSSGAIIGHDDCPGYLFPIGHKSWSELSTLECPSADAESIAAISPLSSDSEGLAFWVKTNGDKFYLARIKAVQPVSYTELVSGDTATLELEWLEP